MTLIMLKIVNKLLILFIIFCCLFAILGDTLNNGAAYVAANIVVGYSLADNIFNLFKPGSEL